MAELIDTLQKVVGNYLNETGMTDMVIGTVTTADPLTITLEGTMIPIQKMNLYLTEPVVLKQIVITGHIHQIESLSHSHTATEGSIGTSLTGSYPTVIQYENMYCVEHGVQLPVVDHTITINRGLEVGDKVLMMRIHDGQDFLILSRVFQ